MIKTLAAGLALVITFSFLVAFTTPGSEGNSPDFQKYWYQGQAEISSYKLEQARYGEVHKGEAVMVFVTENLSNDKHLKADDTGVKREPILKLNCTRKFTTGIYPYSMMMSVFTPVDLALKKTMRVTTSSQEWCGHTFTLVDLEKDNYKVQTHSYFPNEGDVEEKVEAEWLEDEIWTRIRISPDQLPVGEIKMIPSTFYIRLKHKSPKPLNATATLTETPAGKNYMVEYEGGERSISITFDAKFPYMIRSWEEKYMSGWGQKAQVLTTRGTFMASMPLDYWTRNSLADTALRKQLMLD